MPSKFALIMLVIVTSSCMMVVGYLSSTVWAQPPVSTPIRSTQEDSVAGLIQQGSYRRIVARVLPAVVSIEGTIQAPQGLQLPPGIPPEFAPFFQGLYGAPAVAQQTFGSGVIIDARGAILTNYHVVADVQEVRIVTAEGTELPSLKILKDPKTDLAVIKVATNKPLPFLRFGDSDLLAVGDQVLAVGAPFGLTGSVSQGIISAKSRKNLHVNQYEDFIQTDAAINPGNSGGPLVNLAGEIVGINAVIKSKTGGFQGISLAISSNLAKDVTRQLLETGVVRRGYLGLVARDLTPDLIEKLQLPVAQGIILLRIFENTPAAAAALQVGDVIVEIGGKPLKSVSDLPSLIASLKINNTYELIVYRDGKKYRSRITVQEQPEEFSR